jgi:hypothetical protein
MKYALTALVTASLMSTAAHAGTIQAEVRFGGVAKNQAGSTEYKVEFSDSLAGLVNYGAELQTKQAENAGPLASKVSLKAGPVLPTIAGFKPVAYGEVGKNLARLNNFEFWGAGLKVKTDLYGPVSFNTGYRHREGFGNAARNFTENRLNAGLGYAVNDTTTLGATYYRTTGTSRNDAVGISVAKSF